MITILLTFFILITVAVLTHCALGQPDSELVPVLRLCGWLTIAFIAIGQGYNALAVLSAALAVLDAHDPSG